MNDNVNINNLIIIFLALLGLEFFNISPLGKVVKLLQLVGGPMIIGLWIIHVVYGENPKILKMHYSPYIIIILLSLLPSMMMAAYNYDQSLISSLYEQRDIYYYMLYFLLHRMNVRPKFLEKLILYISIIYLLFYLLQYIMYPRIIFDVSIKESRDTLRIALPGAGFALVNYFLCLHKAFRSKYWSLLLINILTFIVFILLGGRQVVFMLIFVTILYVLLSKYVRSKLFIIILGVLGVVSLFFAFENIFLSLVHDTQKTQQAGTENIRLIGINYLLHNAFPNNISYIFGNGTPNINSPYGQFMHILKESKGIFISDIGMFGVYVYYGAFFVIASFAIIFKTFSLKIRKDRIYLKYYFITVLQATMTGIGFIQSDFIVLYCILLYLMDKSVAKKGVALNFHTYTYNKSNKLLGTLPLKSR